MGGLEVLLALSAVAEHRGWKRIRSMEYLGYGKEVTCWYVGEGWEKSRGLQRLKQVVGSLETVGIGYHFYR